MWWLFKFTLLNSIWLYCCTGSAYAEVQFKVCAIQDIVPKTRCDSLSSVGSAACVPAVDSVDCALKLNRGEVNVAKFTAEQALLVGQSLHNDSGTVVASVKHKDNLGEDFSFQTVVIVKKDFKEGLSNLAGKRFCHPGFKFEEAWSRRVLTEFEHTVTKQKCGPSDSYAIEDEFRSLATYFGKSCRPGVWVSTNTTIDKELKQKYKSLCELCDSPETCEYTSSDKNPQNHALRCLTQLNGEVAYVSLEHAKKYFGVNQSDSQNKAADPEQYRFLCPDGTLQTIPTVKPCSWIKQPWPVVVARKEVEQAFKHEVLDSKSETYSNDWKKVLREILTPISHDLIESSGDIVSYIQKGRKFPQPTKDGCRNSFRWCTVNVYEESKCNWLKLAILTAGIRPGLECVSGTSVINCMSKIRGGHADLISIDSNYGYIARKNFKLAPVYYNENIGEKSLIIAVIKNKDADRYSKFSDLKGKNVCMPEYGGIAYISAIAFGRSINNTLTDKNCDYGAALSNFFGNGCVPGARDSDHGVTKGTDADKLCSICQVTESSKSSTSCNADYTNKYYGDVGALDCLSRGGDIAFVEKSLVQDVQDATNYRVLCRNNTLNPYPGFNVDEDCALSASIDSETITRGTDANRPAYELFLSDLEEAFSAINIIKYSTFNMFATFDGRDDVLFKNNTIGFDRTDDPNNKYARNYKQLFKEIDDCTFGGSSTLLVSHLLLLLCGILISFYYV